MIVTINYIVGSLETLAAFPLGLAQGFCLRAYRAARVVQEEYQQTEPLKSHAYVYNLFDLRTNVQRAIRYCSHEAIVHNSVVRYPSNELENLQQAIEELISEPQQINNEN